MPCFAIGMYADDSIHLQPFNVTHSLPFLFLILTLLTLLQKEFAEASQRALCCLQTKLPSCRAHHNIVLGNIVGVYHRDLNLAHEHINGPNNGSEVRRLISFAFLRARKRSIYWINSSTLEHCVLVLLTVGPIFPLPYGPFD